MGKCGCPWQGLCRQPKGFYWATSICWNADESWGTRLTTVSKRVLSIYAWQSRHRLNTGMGVAETWSGNASSLRPISEWSGVRGANPWSSFASSVELRQSSIWHNIVVISSKVSLLSPTIRFKWCLQVLTLFSQREPWWGPVGGLNSTECFDCYRNLWQILGWFFLQEGVPVPLNPC